MPDDARLAHAADQADPELNLQFRRVWSDELVTGPETPAEPAHGTVWHSPGIYARERAEAALGRLVGAARSRVV